MLQETHRQLIKSNEQLLAQLQETKERHELEATQYRRNFDELKQTLALRDPTAPAAAFATAAAPAPAPAEPPPSEREKKKKKPSAR